MRRSWGLVLVMLVALAGPVEARGAGEDVWVLSKGGELLRKLPANGKLWIGAERYVFRWRKGELSAHPLMEDRTVWTAKVPLEAVANTRAWVGGARKERTLVLLTADALWGIDVDTGRRLYHVETKGLWPLLAYASGWGALVDIGEHLPLVHHDAKTIRNADGAPVDQEARTPPEVRWFHVRSGAIVTRMPVAFREKKELVRSIGAIWCVGWQGHVAAFDPKTRSSQTAPRWQVASEHFERWRSYALTRGTQPSLIGRISASGHRARWSRAWPAGSYRILGRSGRSLFLQGEGLLFEVDAHKGDLQARYELYAEARPAHPVRAFRAGATVLASLDDPREVRAYDPATGKTRWTRAHAGVAAVDGGTALLVTPGVEVKGEAVARARLERVDASTGTARWTWAIPGPPGGYADGMRVEVLGFGYGSYLIRRSWYVLD